MFRTTGDRLPHCRESHPPTDLGQTAWSLCLGGSRHALPR